MLQTNELLLDDLIALYLKYNRIEWARSYQTKNHTIAITTGTQAELQYHHIGDPLWHNGVKVQ